MPTLFRLVMLVGLLAALVVGTIIALPLLVKPTPRDMSVTVPVERINKK